jgi:hypothetical protein
MSVSSIQAELLAIVDEFASWPAASTGSASPDAIGTTSPVPHRESLPEQAWVPATPVDSFTHTAGSAGPSFSPEAPAPPLPPSDRDSLRGNKVLLVASIIGTSLVLAAGLLTFRSLRPPLSSAPDSRRHQVQAPPEIVAPLKRLPEKRPGRTESPQPRLPMQRVPAATAAPSHAPSPEAIVAQMLERIPTYMGQNSPGRAYQLAMAALDSIRAIQSSGNTSGAIEELKAKAERLANISARQCDNQTDPSVIRTGCPP